MPSGGQTTVIQRILERRAQRPLDTNGETTATLAVMLRVVPPPKALLVCQDPPLRRQLERRITAGLLECESVLDERAALQRCASGSSSASPPVCSSASPCQMSTRRCIAARANIARSS